MSVTDQTPYAMKGIGVGDAWKWYERAMIRLDIFNYFAIV
jgi:hypothetical protein